MGQIPIVVVLKQFQGQSKSVARAVPEFRKRTATLMLPSAFPGEHVIAAAVSRKRTKRTGPWCDALHLGITVSAKREQDSGVMRCAQAFVQRLFMRFSVVAS